MEQYILRFPGAMILSVFLALILTLIPLPASLDSWRPEWFALVIIHWGIMTPRQSSYLLAWCSGLLLDIIYGTALGQQALGLVIVNFITLRLSARMTPKALTQQVSLIFFALGTYLLINLWLLGTMNNKPPWSYWLPLISSIIIWPAFSLIMHLFYKNKKEF